MQLTRLRYLAEVWASRLYTALIQREFATADGACVWWDAKITNPRFIHLGRGVTVMSGSWLLAITSDPEGNTFSPRIEIQNDAYLGHRLHLTAAQEVVIEKEVMVADGVYISDNFHDFRDPFRPVLRQRVFTKGPLRIKKNAFIGEGARIIGPVTVGENSVVGANSVVTRDVPDRCVVAGVPARVIQHYDEATGGWRQGPREGFP